MFYTSGTTGRSKGAMLRHRSLTAMTVAHLADIDNPDQELQPDPRRSDVTWLRPRRPPVRAARCPPGGTRFGRRSIPPSSWIFASPSGLQRVPAPTMVQRLVETGRERPGNLRTIVYGGGPMTSKSEEGNGGSRAGVRRDLRPGRVPRTIMVFAVPTMNGRRRDTRGLSVMCGRHGSRGAAR